MKIIEITPETTQKVQAKQLNKEMLLLQFKVMDSGMGIASEQQKRIFDSFVQADDSPNRRFGGTGLGLRICRQLCQLMGG